MKTTRLLFSVLCLLASVLGFTGCSLVPQYRSDEVHRTISFPGFSDEVHALGIKKDTAEDGTVIRKAETLTHTTSIAGFSRSATYKGAELETKPEAKE
jgi:hypothetical protein